MNRLLLDWLGRIFRPFPSNNIIIKQRGDGIQNGRTFSLAIKETKSLQLVQKGNYDCNDLQLNVWKVAFSANQSLRCKVKFSAFSPISRPTALSSEQP